MTDKRDRDVVIRGNLSRATADLVARQFLLQILTVNSRLRPVDSDCRPLTFRILVDMLDGCTPTGGGIDEPTYGSWGPASGYPFEANKMDQAKASIATSDWAAATADTTVSSLTRPRPVLHPLQSLDSGVIHVALRVEEFPLFKQNTPGHPLSSGDATWSSSNTPTPSAATHKPMETARTPPRDLDDPMLEYDVGERVSQIPLRKRKLFAQVQGGGGPMSDESSESYSSSSSDSGLN